MIVIKCLPLAHGSGADAPGGHTDPASHRRHDVAFGSGWYVPPPHGAHSDAPNEAETEPGEHGAGATEPVGLALPGGLGRHSEAEESRVEFEYVPPKHSWGKALPVGQNAPRGQATGSTVAAVGQ